MFKIQGIAIAKEIATNIDLGFVPDYVELYELTSTPKLLYTWFKLLADEKTTGRYGLRNTDDGDASDLEACASEDAGIIPYDEDDDDGVMVLHPSIEKLVRLPIKDWLASGTGSNYSDTDYGNDRTATRNGTMVRPPVKNGYVYELKTSSGAGTSIPTAGWATEPGEECTDGGSNVWICRKEIAIHVGGKGFTVGVDIAVNSEIWAFVAEKHDRSVNLGDVDGFDPVRFDSN